MKKNIYIISIPNEEENNVSSYAICEDGYIVAYHISTNISWAKHDMGVKSNWKHKQYWEHCPEGFKLVWVDYDKVEQHEEFQKAYKLNQKLFRKED